MNNKLIVALLVAFIFISMSGVFAVPQFKDREMRPNYEYIWSDIIINGTSASEPIARSLNFTVFSANATTVFSTDTDYDSNGYHNVTFRLNEPKGIYYWRLLDEINNEVYAGESFDLQYECKVWDYQYCQNRDITGTVS